MTLMKSTMFRHVLIVPLTCVAWLAGCGDDDAESSSTQVMTTPRLGDVVVVESSLTHNAVTLRASLEDWGGDPDVCGLCWATVQNPTVDVLTKVNASVSEPGSFDIQLTGLLPETSYYARAYARNRRGLVYSAQVQFTTLAESPELMDYAEVGSVELVGVPGRVSATFSFEIISDGGGMLRSAGLCVGEGHMPTAETGTLVEMSAPKVGAFVLDAGGLTPGTTYYIRAFAQNAKGVVYGDEELEFTTEEADMTLKGNAGPLLIGGTAEVPLNTNPTTEGIIDTEYNVLQIPCYPTAWNNWSSLEVFDLSAQKAWVDWCKERGKKSIGHFLMSHNTYYPSWLTSPSTPWTVEQLSEMLENRIKNVIESMSGDRVDMWTVVNEATILANKKGSYRPCVWTPLGTEPEESGMGYNAANVENEIPVYIRLSFEFARKYAPEAELILSDAGFELSLETDKRCCAFRQLVKHLLAKGTPIDAVALQTHIKFGQAGFDDPENTPRWDLFEKHIKWLKNTGLKVYLNEVDISQTFTVPTVLTETQLENQKKAYKKCVNMAIGAGIDGIFFWGLGDGHDPSFRPYDSAQMYDYDHNRKPAFYGVLEALMANYPSAE